MKLTTLALCLLLAPLVARAQSCPPATTVYLHGNILTGVGMHALDEPHTQPQRVQALAIANGRIIRTGTDADVLACATPATVQVDLHGAFVMPGFNDAHTHIADAGLQRLSANLTGSTSLADMQARIAAYVKTLPPGDTSTWILGGGWDHTLWPSKTLPTRQDIDAVTAGHPAFLYRVDGHIAIANTAALAAAGIDATTPDPPGGHIDRDANGNPTGIIREIPANSLIESHIPPPPYATRKKALLLSIQDALANGVTSVQDYSTWEDWLILEELEQENKLPLRVAEWIDFNLPVAVLKTRRASHDPNDPLLHLTFLKGFMDGSLGSRTAAMNDPYTDEPTNYGIPRYDQERLNDMAVERTAAGFQLGFHAIGDRANDMALNAFSAAEQAGIPAPIYLCQQHELQYENSLPSDAIVTRTDPCPAPPYAPVAFRLRIEHAQVVSPGSFERFHQLGVIASMQPSHLLTDMAWAPARLGPNRLRYAYAWHSFLDHHVTLAFGTDYPVESINPMRGLYAAITRMNVAGTATFDPADAPHERLTLDEALFAYTQASAFAEFREHIKGQLAPGFLADFVVLDRDLTASTPQQILHARVLRTVVGGATRFTAEPSETPQPADSAQTPDSAPQPDNTPQPPDNSAQPPDNAPPGRAIGPHSEPATTSPPRAPHKPSPYDNPTNPDATTGVSNPPPDNPQ